MRRRFEREQGRNQDPRDMGFERQGRFEDSSRMMGGQQGMRGTRPANEPPREHVEHDAEWYWRTGREHRSGYAANADAHGQYDQGYRGTPEDHDYAHESRLGRATDQMRRKDSDRDFDDGSWSGYSADGNESTRQPEFGGTTAMRAGSFRGHGWGGEAMRGGVGGPNFASPYGARGTGGTEAYRDTGARSVGGDFDRGLRAREARDQRGPHHGKGPKGYTRSDARIHEDVCERLADHDELDASEIEVKVEAGEVTLTGTVEDRRFKHLAEHIADTVGGVRDIHNQIRVRRHGVLATNETAPRDGTTASPNGTTGVNNNGRATTQGRH